MKKWLRSAVLLLVCGLLAGACGCEEQSRPANNQTYEEPAANLKAIILGTPPAEGLDELYRQLDALTIPELNCTLRFEYIPWGDERNQLNIAVVSGEYDLIPGGVFSDYRILTGKNAFLDLNDYLYLVPELTEHYSTYSDDLLRSCEINGGLYGIPQYSIGVLHTDEGMVYREDLRREWGLAPITDLESLEAYLYRAKEEPQYQNEPLITDNRIWTSLWLMINQGKYVELVSMLETPLVVALAENPSVLVSRVETPEFAEMVEYLAKWKQAGILDPNLLALSDNEGERSRLLILSDRKPCETNSPYWSVSASLPRVVQELHPEWELGFFPYTKNDRRWYMESISDASVISVSSRTRYPKEAVKLLSKIHTDQRYYDLVRYGVQGIHYELKEDLLDYSNISDNNGFGWTPVTDRLLSRDTVPASIVWEESVNKPYQQWQEEVLAVAEPNPLGAFAPEVSGLGQVLNQLQQVQIQQFKPIVCGYPTDCRQALSDLTAALYQAGFQEYLDTIQQQLTEALAE